MIPSSEVIMTHIDESCLVSSVEVPQKVGDTGIIPYQDVEFFEIEEISKTELSLSVPISPDGPFVPSDVVENATSMINDLDDDLEDRPSPELAVSPNPVSPARASAPGNPKGFSQTITTPQSTSVQKLPAPSRLVDISELRKSNLCMHVFSSWRVEVLRQQVESFRAELETVSRASEVILEENERLKKRITELEEAAALVAEMISAPPVTETTAYITPTGGNYNMSMHSSVFVSPMSVGYTSPIREVERVPHGTSSQTPAVINIATPTTLPQEDPLVDTRKSWDEYLKAPFSLTPQAVASPGIIPVLRENVGRPKSEKYKELSENLAKLTESIGKF